MAGRFLACGVFLTVLSMAWGEVIRPGQAALAEKLLTEYNANLAPYFKGSVSRPPEHSLCNVWC
eukprot:516570-Rhodomonas_salina.3